MHDVRRRSPALIGIFAGLGAAVLFGAATPISKELLDELEPQLLAGLLYLGAFAGVGGAVVARRGTREAPLRREDLARLSGLVTAGGVVAPVLLLLGLERVQGTTASLLLNLEGVATLLIGIVLFKEHLSTRAVTGAGIVFVGAVLLTIQTGGGRVDPIGIGCITGACVCWGFDNNLTQSLSSRDPFKLVAVKTGVSATVNLTIALALGASLPFDTVLVGALIVGAVSYGASIVLDAYALRLVGAAREAIVFATAPFVGALLAVPILSENLGTRELLSGAAMAVGVVFVVTERHQHLHEHAPIDHEHLHVHDEHHQHTHPSGTVAEEPHSHRHVHDELVHRHQHVSDSHHRHPH